jgi:hypothetical protein
MRINYFWVHDSNGTRKYFSDADTKRANEYAQLLADSTQKPVIRHDRDGGQSWFYASETTADGYRIYAGN